jgi:hypothetical protein
MHHRYLSSYRTGLLRNVSDGAKVKTEVSLLNEKNKTYFSQLSLDAVEHGTEPFEVFQKE